MLTEYSVELLPRGGAVVEGLLADGYGDLREVPAEELWMQSLLPSGLTIQGAAGPIGGRLVYNVTRLGQAFQRAVEDR